MSAETFHAPTTITFDVVAAPVRSGWSWNVRKQSERGTAFAPESWVTHTSWGMRRKVARFVRQTLKNELKTREI